MKYENYIKLEFPSKSCNEALARSVAGVFASQMDPTMEELGDIKTAVSEAVTNAIVHAYTEKNGKVILRAWIDEDAIRIEVEDMGRGIENIEQAMQPFYTTQPDQERTGMGFALMQSFMDSVRVQSSPGNGTLVFMQKRLHENDE
mgnify:CR=1 FL=1